MNHNKKLKRIDKIETINLYFFETNLNELIIKITEYIEK